MSVAHIVDQVATFGCDWVEITGGEPLLQEKVLPFMSRLCDEGFKVLIETGGHMSIENIDDRVKRIMDVKCPSSGEANKMYWHNMDLLNKNDQVKFVIGNLEDYEFTRETITKYKLNKMCTVLLSPVFGELNPQELAEWILKDSLPVRMQLQMHKFIWQPETRGV